MNRYADAGPRLTWFDIAFWCVLWALGMIAGFVVGWALLGSPGTSLMRFVLL